MKPGNLPDWETYIKRLAGPALWSKVVAANTQKFVDTLLADKFSMQGVQTIMVYFARQLIQTGQKIPAGGAFDLMDIARRNPLCRDCLPFTGDQVQGMIDRLPPETDEFSATLDFMSTAE